MLKEKWSWIIIFMMILIMLSNLCDVNNACWEEERAALLYIKAYFRDPSYYDDYDPFQSWKEDKRSNCCNGWDGVSCGMDGGVITLSLGDTTRRVKHLNASIFLPFQQLRELDLSYNYIDSWTEVKGSETETNLSSGLSKLETLDLSGNSFNSSILPYLSGFHSLKHLFLGSNQLGGTIDLNDFGGFKNLKELDLGYNQIHAFVTYYYKDVGTQPSIFKDLEKLDLSGNTINGSIDMLPLLNNLQSVKSLSLSYNQIAGPIPLCHMEGLRNLEEMDLSDNEYFQGFINCNGSAKGLSSLVKLKTLDLSFTNLNHSASLQNHSGFNGLCQFKKLQSLDLSDCNLGEMLPSCMGSLTALRVLDLSFSQIEGNIPSWMGNLTALQSLNLSNNYFNGNIADSALVNLTNLEILKLQDNHFQIPYSFKSFANHTKLKYFIGDSNEVILDVEDISFTPGFQLQVLSLSNSNLSAFPPFLRHQNNLSIIDFSQNSLQRNFPSWLLENTSSLKVLFLQNNLLTGSFELSYPLYPSKIIALDVSQNNLHGQIHQHIGDKFLQIRYLFMRNNKLNGKIPWSIGRMKSLEELVLSNNKLIGTLPTNLFDGCLSLRLLDVSNNNLDGQIPSVHLNYELSSLILANNSLDGPDLGIICKFHGLEYLDLSYNKLGGSIPPCFSNLSQLRTVRLNNNRLRGPIIHPYPYNSWLKTIDLSNNKLNGSISSQLSNTIHLRFLLLKNNMLNGDIPDQLCKLKDLLMLDLSHNMLSGSLPSCLGGNAFDPTVVNEQFFEILIPGVFWDNYEYNVDQPIDQPVEFTTKSNTYSYQAVDNHFVSGIDLSSNMLTGKIPHEWGNLTNIQSLNLSHNNLQGDIPTTFSKMQKIESLDLSYNNLSGSIPTELNALNFLEVFIVAHNNLSGAIPLGTQFSTSNASYYEGNPFLCGPPLSKKCTLSPSDANGFQHQVVEEDNGWIDMETFYVTFGVTGITMFLTVLVILRINPYWGRALFYLATTCATSTYYFIEDVIWTIKRT